MINLKEVDIAELPSLPLIGRSKLPHVPAIYFIVSSDNDILYIGQTADLYKRWQIHHRYKQSILMGDVRLAWIAISDVSDLPESEKIAIEYFQPLWNGEKIPDYIGADQTNVRLDGQAKLDARAIAKHYGLNGVSAAIRFALRELARTIIEREQP